MRSVININGRGGHRALGQREREEAVIFTAGQSGHIHSRTEQSYSQQDRAVIFTAGQSSHMDSRTEGLSTV